jgi:hypothetical protein
MTVAAPPFGASETPAPPSLGTSPTAVAPDQEEDMGEKDTDEDELPDIKDVLLSCKRERKVWIDLTNDSDGSDDEMRTVLFIDRTSCLGG